MQRVGIEILKNRLSEYVKIAASGERVIVTDRDRVVAELVPPGTRHGLPYDDVVARGLREGWIRPAEASPADPLPERGIAPDDDPDIPFDTLMADLARDREDR